MENMIYVSMFCVMLALTIPIAFYFYKPRWLIGGIIISFIACSSALCAQLFYQSYAIKQMDWTALLDTAPILAVYAFVFLCVTMTLNISTLLKTISASKL